MTKPLPIDGVNAILGISPMLAAIQHFHESVPKVEPRRIVVSKHVPPDTCVRLPATNNGVFQKPVIETWILGANVWWDMTFNLHQHTAPKRTSPSRDITELFDGGIPVEFSPPDWRP